MTSRKAGFDKSNPYRSASKVRYVHFRGISSLDAACPPRPETGTGSGGAMTL